MAGERHGMCKSAFRNSPLPSVRELFCSSDISTLSLRQCCTFVFFWEMRGEGVTVKDHLTLRPIIHSNIICELTVRSFKCCREVGWVGVTFPPPTAALKTWFPHQTTVFASALDTRGQQESRNGIDFEFFIFFVQLFFCLAWFTSDFTYSTDTGPSLKVIQVVRKKNTKRIKGKWKREKKSLRVYGGTGTVAAKERRNPSECTAGREPLQQKWRPYRQ